MDPTLIPLVLVAIPLAFAVSASAGLGGSLVMVPILMMALGPKEGVALAALLLAANNVVKVGAYRATVPWRAALPLVLCTLIGTFVGARALVAVDEGVVTVAVFVVLVVSLITEVVGRPSTRRATSPVLSLAAGATSGFSGTSGPLKGVAIRALSLDRLHLVGAASIISLVGDATKAGVFAEAGLLTATSVRIAVVSVPLMFLGTFGGRYINRRIGERGYRLLFWTVTGGYAVRLLASA